MKPSINSFITIVDIFYAITLTLNIGALFYVAVTAPSRSLWLLFWIVWVTAGIVFGYACDRKDARHVR